MNRIPTFILIPVIGFVFIASCKRTIPCSDDFITPAFVGFKLSDLDTIIVRQYKKNGAFMELIDTATLSFDTTYLKSKSTNDTTFVLLNYISGKEKYIFPDHDWQIYIPAKKITFSISNIISTQKESPCFKCSCVNPIDSFIINTQTTIPQLGKIPYLGGRYYLTYLHS